MSTQEALLKAANLIEEKGWWNGNAPSQGRVCAGVAIARICEENGLETDRVARVVTEQLGLEAGFVPLFIWNDKQENGEVVVNVLREVANGELL